MSQGACSDREPLLVAVALSCAQPEQLSAIENHAACCAACRVALDESRALAAESAEHVPAPSPRVRAAVLAQVHRDLQHQHHKLAQPRPAAANLRRIGLSVAAGAVASFAGLALADWRAPLAGGLPLLLCALSWTSILSLGFYLASSASAERARVALGGLVAVGALLAMTVVCPAPDLVAAGRSASWLPSALQTGAASEWLTGLALGMLPVVLALGICLGIGAATRAASDRPMLGAAALLTLSIAGIELTLLFAQCCDLPSIRAVPLLLGAGVGSSVGLITGRLIPRAMRRTRSPSH